MALQTHLEVIVLQPLFLQELHQTADLLLQDLILGFYFLDKILFRWLLKGFHFQTVDLGPQLMHLRAMFIALILMKLNLLLSLIQLLLQRLDRLCRALQLVTHRYQILGQLPYLSFILGHLCRIH